MDRTEIISRTARIISEPGKRTTSGHMAVNKAGNPVRPHLRSARAWCPIGAMFHIAGVDSDKPEKYPRGLIQCLAAFDWYCCRLFSKSSIEISNTAPLEDVLTALRKTYTMVQNMKDEDAFGNEIQR